VIGNDAAVAFGGAAGNFELNVMLPVIGRNLLASGRLLTAVVPLLAGSGTRFKVLEAWAACTPVISTNLGAEGLHYTAGEHLLICDDPSEFAEAVAFLLEAPEARAQLAEAGRNMYETHYTWNVAWDSLEHELSAFTQNN
jgi:glycosyltransferase involved in cell wall biosynthesis